MTDPYLTSGSCLDPDTLAAFVDGKAPPEARQRVIEHLADCERCAELVAETVRSVEAVQDSDRRPGTTVGAISSRSPRHRSWRPVTSWMAAAAVVILAVGVGWWQLREPPQADDPRRGLIAAAGPTRVVEGRLTGGFPYAEFRTPDRGTTLPDNLALVAAAGELQRQVARNSTPETLHAWGAAQLALGQYDPGLESLESLKVTHGATAMLAADLAVGYLARAATLGKPEDLPRALQSTEEALRLDPNLAEAWFTKALVLERLEMRSEAREAWRAYLRLDGSSAWSNEARQRLARLESQSSESRWAEIEQRALRGALDGMQLAEAIEQYGSDLKELVLRELLPAWAAAMPSSALDATGPGGRIATALKQRGDDATFALTFERIGAMPPAERAAAAEGLRHLAEGMRAQREQGAPEVIRRHFTEAIGALRTVSSGVHLWAELGLARLAYAAQAHQEVRWRAEAIAREASARHASSVEARAHWLLGMTAFTTGQWTAAARHYDRALQLCATASEGALAAAVHVNASILRRFLGDRRGTWAHRMAAAAVLPRHDPLQVHIYLTSGAATSSIEAMPDVALLFQNAVVTNATTRLRIGPQTEAFITRARMLSRLERFDQADADLAEALRLMSRIAAEPLHRRLRRAWLLASAEANVSRNPSRAAKDAAEAMDLIRAAGEPVRVAEAALAGSRALALLAQRSAALEMADQGLADFERSLASLDSRDTTRLAALEPVWALYAHAARLRLADGQGDLEAAFDAVERGRARMLIERRNAVRLSLAAVRQRLHHREAVLILDQGADDLVTWWITRAGAQTSRVPIRMDAVQRLVYGHRRSVREGQRQHPASAELFEIALAPWRQFIRSTDAVALVPDGVWSHVAWAALWDKETAAELVLSTRVVVSPSVSAALADPAGSSRAGAPPAALVIAPTVAGQAALPAARDEARSIAAGYRVRALLDGASATPQRLMNAVGQADIVHVSSHAIDVPEHPQLSHLVLAGEGDDGRLFVRDIAAADLSRVRLVVLAACATAGRAAVRGEGSVGVAWGFLTAGVRQVIATLEDIEDRPAAEFFTAVHRRLIAGETPARALHQTQREMAASGASPRLWAVVTLMGSLR